MVTTSQQMSQSRSPSWLAVLFRTHNTTRTVDIALIVVRIALAWIFFVYGAQKLFGWFNGPGIDGTAQFMADGAGLKPGKFFAYAAGIIEFGGAIALALGILARLVGLALLVDMVIAMITTTWEQGLHQTTGVGYELNVALAALAVVVALLGAGRFSADAVVEQGLGAAGDSSVP
jgi:putative oxidoreductase